jgi:hypothetical protein
VLGADGRVRSKAAVNQRGERAAPSDFYVAEQEATLTTANGSSLSELASKFLKFCRVPLPGMVTWGKI